MTLRVSKADKRRIQNAARKNGESVSALLLRAATEAAKLPPRAPDNPQGGKVIHISLTAPLSPEETRKAAAEPTVRFELDADAYELAQ